MLRKIVIEDSQDVVIGIGELKEYKIALEKAREILLKRGEDVGFIESILYGESSDTRPDCLPTQNPSMYPYVLEKGFKKLKARMLNLIESGARDTKQCNAMSGLCKDFFSESLMSMCNDMEVFLHDQGVLDEHSAQYSPLLTD